MAAQPAPAAGRPDRAGRGHEDRRGLHSGLREHRHHRGGQLPRHPADAHRLPEHRRGHLRGRLHGHRHVRHRADSDLPLPVPDPPAAGRGRPHACAAHLVWQLHGRVEHQRHAPGRGAAAERVRADRLGDDAVVHRRPGQRPGQRGRLEHDQPQRLMRALHARAPRRVLEHLLRPRQRVGLQRRPDVGRRGRLLRRRVELGIDQRGVRRRLRAVRPPGNVVRSGRHERLPLRWRGRGPPERVRRGHGPAAGAAACDDAAPRAQHRPCGDRHPAEQRRRTARRGVRRRRRLSQHHRRGHSRRHRTRPFARQP